MRLMKKLINSRITLKQILQSLPIVLAAIAFVIYGLSFLPYSISRMGKSTAIIEYTSYYTIDNNGKHIIWFKTLTDSLLPEDMALAADTSTTNKSYITGCWINRYPFFPSCKGRILSIYPDSASYEKTTTANKSLASIIGKKINKIEERIQLLDKQAEEIEYYLSVHNVSDEGYNTIAAYSANVKTQKEKEEKLLSTMKSLIGQKGLSVHLNEKYTLLYIDTSGTTQRKTCLRKTKVSGKPFILLQTEDKKMPDNTTALYLHKWFIPNADAEDIVISAAHFGSTQQGFSMKASSAKTFQGKIKSDYKHDIPPLLAPDGSPIFSKSGFFMGISYKGNIIRASEFGFGLKHLQP